MNARDVGLLVLRLGLGTVMFAHGARNLLGWWGGLGIDAYLGWMGTIGVPAPLAWLAMLVEFAGGIGVLLGIFTRVAALGFAVNMVVAMAIVHGQNGFFLGGEGGDGIEFTFLLLCAAIAVALLGPGRFALVDRER